MKLTFLGTGTSTGVPQIGCKCDVCTSTDVREKRWRASALVEVDGSHRFLIDCGPDFREQILRKGAPAIDGLLITHSHYDHVGGVDDLRPYCGNKPFDVYCLPDVEHDLRTRLPYCFKEHPYPGVPTFNFHPLSFNKPFTVCSTEILPLEVLHGNLPIVGFKFGNTAYITDCSFLPPSSLEKIKGVRTLIINALRHRPHFSHMNLDQALNVIKTVNPHRAFLTHLSHEMGKMDTVKPLLPPNVEVAVDGMEIEIT